MRYFELFESISDDVINILAKKHRNIWIRADGKVTMLPPNAIHDDEARYYFPKSERPHVDAIAAGWIRMATAKYGEEIFVMLLPSATQEARKATVNILRGLSKNVIRVTISDSENDQNYSIYEQNEQSRAKTWLQDAVHHI